jgi:hypothetical protein
MTGIGDIVLELGKLLITGTVDVITEAIKNDY